ncbi:S-layer homology domain-containing protein [Peptoniphilus sp. KCTC 25270]|uniref:S-layer homology domain-containing protein n=1 Tax=Peptoniphilus sp. KCTC 25270 TaxID=2897414 RepID=UPI001E53BE05|nr:S-layer homology domain-containing protein [Peptoniphilus sp. KCTC 25270]MCD1147756.1 S-layer homology domain-containing protein [Peptoniphilus sp. KCTC 25270]
MKRFLSLFLAVVMVFTILPYEAKAADGDYNATITFIDNTQKFSNGTNTITKEFTNPNEAIGNFGKYDNGSGFFKQYFVGWSNEANPDGTSLYFSHENIGKIIPNGGEKTLYAHWVGGLDLLTLSAKNGLVIDINSGVSDKETLPNNLIKVSEGFDGSSDKYLVAYYDQEKEINEIKFSTYLIPHKYVALMTYANPGGVLSNAGDWANLNDGAQYTHIDIELNMDEDITVANSLDLSFTSYAFKPHAFISEDNTRLDGAKVQAKNDPTVRMEASNNDTNPNHIKLRNTIRNDFNTTYSIVGDYAQVTSPYKLESNRIQDFIIKKDIAKNLAKNNIGKNFGTYENVNKDLDFLISNGFIDGISNPASLKSEIPRVDSSDFSITFVAPIARFDRNSLNLGENEDKQNEGFSIFALNGAMNSDDFNTGTQPNIELSQAGDTFIKDDNYKIVETKITFNGKDYIFKGWNTQADGKGKFVTRETVITPDMLNQKDNDKVEEDMTLYAIWAEEESKPEPWMPVKPIPDSGLLNKEDHKAYMFGYPDWTFRQEGNMTRAEATAMFARLMKDYPKEQRTYNINYPDVAMDQWHYEAVGYMSEMNIVEGYQDGTFQPNAPITRAEFATMASRFDELAKTGGANFIDVENNHWALAYINSAATKGWVNGYPDGTFKPNQSITRAEVVTVTNRMLNRKADEVFVIENIDKITNFTDLTPAHWAYYNIQEATNGHDYNRLENGIDEDWIQLNGEEFNFAVSGYAE